MDSVLSRALLARTVRDERSWAMTHYTIAFWCTSDEMNHR